MRREPRASAVWGTHASATTAPTTCLVSVRAGRYSVYDFTGESARTPSFLRGAWSRLTLRPQFKKVWSMREPVPATDVGPADKEEDGGEHWYDVSRVVMFSDAVFAVAITLLVLNILPFADFSSSPTSQQIVERLLSSPFLFQLFSYVLSFTVIGVYWQRHHWIFRHIVKTDGGLLWLSLTLLLFIVFLPFPTELLGRFGNTSIVVALYAGVLVMLSVVQLLLWEYAVAHRRLVRPDLSQKTIARIRTRLLLPIPVLAISIVLAYVSPFLAEAVWLIMLLISPIVLRLYWTRTR